MPEREARVSQGGEGRVRRRNPLPELDPVDAAEVLAATARSDWHETTKELAAVALVALSERAGGGGFAVLPDGNGKYPLMKLEKAHAARCLHHQGGACDCFAGLKAWYVLAPVVEGDDA